jgi:hypothetical protein
LFVVAVVVIVLISIADVLIMSLLQFFLLLLRAPSAPLLRCFE